MVLKVKVRCGSQEFDAHINASDVDETNNNSSEPSPSSMKLLKTVGDLRQFIADATNSDPMRLKIIHRGKFIGINNDEPLRNYEFKETDKLMVMGSVKSSITEDSGFKALVDYEKNHLVPLNNTFDRNSKELTELERNFLEGKFVKEMIKRMDKQLQLFTQTSLRHLETIDAITIFDEKTSDSQKARNREKRKTLINGIQDLLNRNDTLLFKLSQYSFKVEHPDEGH